VNKKTFELRREIHGGYEDHLEFVLAVGYTPTTSGTTESLDLDGIEYSFIPCDCPCRV
jgi:hypothetical protein